MTETLLRIQQPFRKHCVLLTIMLVGLTTAWSFEFATVALEASDTQFLQVGAIIIAIQGLITYFMKEVFKMYWKGRS